MKPAFALEDTIGLSFAVLNIPQYIVHQSVFNLSGQAILANS